MKCWLSLGLSLLFLGTGLPSVFGNMSPIPGLDGPIPHPKHEVKVVVKMDAKAKMPRLQIPYKLIYDVRLTPNPAETSPSKAPKRGSAGRSALNTLVAGFALALAFAAAGLWLVRRRGGRFLTVLLIGAILSVTGTAFLWSNAPPPAPLSAKPAAAELPMLKLPAGIELTDKLILEVVPTGEHLTLVVPKASVLKPEKEAAAETSSK